MQLVRVDRGRWPEKVYEVVGRTGNGAVILTDTGDGTMWEVPSLNWTVPYFSSDTIELVDDTEYWKAIAAREAYDQV